MSDTRLVNVVPIVNRWHDGAKKALEEAKTLMASGNHRDYNTGVVEESIANLVSRFADELIKAPSVDPETLRPVAKWENECDAVGDPIVWTCTNCKDSAILYEGTPKESGMKFCPYCGAKMEDNNA